ncbi:MAG: hypothetical protein U0821_08455 [Chloroflexota bacterium]
MNNSHVPTSRLARRARWVLRVALFLSVIAWIQPAAAAGLAPRATDTEARQLNPYIWPSHDWRSPGFISVVDGKMYDPDCWPIQSVGSNVPNLIYRESILENLEWMRQHRVRWIRIFITGHREQLDLSPDLAIGRLGELVRLVEAYNARIPKSEAIYLFVVLTDYYGQGVPGDTYTRDNPQGCEFVVLPAPWFRRDHRSFDFESECGDPLVRDAPNYEVNYKPWVMQIVSAMADSPTILGWQLGNELKARSSTRNGISIDTAFDWYSEFVRDMVDSIRSVDRNHVIITPGQYFSEMIDLPYRPDGKNLESSLRTTYLRRLDSVMRDCGEYCWNVWNLTFYDFNLYPADDAMALARGNVATLATEYGFTLGTKYEEDVRFGGDRLQALRSGISRSWQDVFNENHDAFWGLSETTTQLKLSGIAAWGSTNPDPETDPGSDLDRRRGISHAPEGMSLWNQWGSVANELEFRNAKSGQSSACLDANTSGRSAPPPSGSRPTPTSPLAFRVSDPPSPPLEVTGFVVGINTDPNDPFIEIEVSRGRELVRLPRGRAARAIKPVNLRDNVRVKGWPMGDDVVWATSIESAGRR